MRGLPPEPKISELREKKKKRYYAHAIDTHKWQFARFERPYIVFVCPCGAIKRQSITEEIIEKVVE